MKIRLTIILFCFTLTSLLGQKTDTLTFFSQAFHQNRTIYIKTPEFYKYQSDSVLLPVFYVLDGQYEWFVNPLLSTIEYLQYTHEIPQALIVIIPLEDRISECAINNLDGEVLALHRFITVDVVEQIAPYHPNDFKLLIGHSFSASFALYSFLKYPEYYSAIIANSPMDKFEELIVGLQKHNESDLDKISISVGGIAEDKDYYHRRNYNILKDKYPDFFKKINVFEADFSSHNAVPIVATPSLLSKIFLEFRSRYSNIAKVDQEYHLIETPESVDNEMNKIETASRLGNSYYPPEIADINGLASRYLNSGYTEYGISTYLFGLKHYPNYYEFHFALYELFLPDDPERAKAHLNKAADLLHSVETELPERQLLIDEIETERKKNSW